MAKGIFITGTGTDVGKTFVTALLVKKLKEIKENNAYYKAAMSGNEKDRSGKLIPGDALYVKQVSQIAQKVDSMCPYVYQTAVSPHLASRMEGNPVTMDKVLKDYYSLVKKYDYITVEGSGGILCPICFDEAEIWLEDIVKEMKIPTLINSLVLTYEYMKQKNISCKGIIFNKWEEGNVMHQDNLAMCEYRTGLKVLACIPENAKKLGIEDEILLSLYEEVCQ